MGRNRKYYNNNKVKETKATYQAAPGECQRSERVPYSPPPTSTPSHPIQPNKEVIKIEANNV